MSICVGPPDPDEFLVLDAIFILSYVFIDDPPCFGFKLVSYG